MSIIAELCHLNMDQQTENICQDLIELQIEMNSTAQKSPIFRRIKEKYDLKFDQLIQNQSTQ